MGEVCPESRVEVSPRDSAVMTAAILDQVLCEATEKPYALTICPLNARCFERGSTFK